MSKEILYETSTHYLMLHCSEINEKTYFVVERDNSTEFELITTDLDEAMTWIMSSV